jgi:hypothetical protein
MRAGRLPGSAETRASRASPGAGVTAAVGHSLPASHSKTRIAKTFFYT